MPWGLRWSCQKFCSNVALHHQEGVLCIICAVAGSDAIKWFRSCSPDAMCTATCCSESAQPTAMSPSLCAPWSAHVDHHLKTFGNNQRAKPIAYCMKSGSLRARKPRVPPVYITTGQHTLPQMTELHVDSARQRIAATKKKRNHGLNCALTECCLKRTSPRQNDSSLAKLLHCVGTVWALRAPAGKLTQDRLPPVCWHSKAANPTK